MLKSVIPFEVYKGGIVMESLKQILGAMVMSLIIVTLVFLGVHYKGTKGESRQEEVIIVEEDVKVEEIVSKGDMSIHPEDMVIYFIENGLEETREEYEGKNVNMTGEIEKVDVDELGGYYMDILTGIDDVPVIRYYVKDNYESMESTFWELEEGYKVEIVGKVFSVSNFYIELVDSDYKILN